MLREVFWYILQEYMDTCDYFALGTFLPAEVVYNYTTKKLRIYTTFMPDMLSSRVSLFGPVFLVSEFDISTVREEFGFLLDLGKKEM